jgi:predicted RNA-binding Zn-ribbon protein involved in translation (DUF1610 family)
MEGDVYIKAIFSLAGVGSFIYQMKNSGFCLNCGQPIISIYKKTRFCPNCGKDIHKDARGSK